MLRKIAVSIFIIICANFYICNSYAEVPNIYIDNAIKEEGTDEITVDLNVENLDSNISSLGLNINYDQTKLEYVSSKHGKNLKTTVQMSEYVEKDKILLRIKGQDGLKNDGTYYQLTFKVLDENVEKIPVNVDLKEAKDINGNVVKCNVSNGTVYTKEQYAPKEEIEKKEETTSKTNSSENTKVEEKQPLIKPFEKTEIDKSETLADIVTSNVEENAPIKKENLKYEVKDKDILEVLDNGNMIPKKDGITQVIIKQDGEEIGVMEVEVKNGEIKKITSEYKPQTTENAQESKTPNKIVNEKEEKESVTKGGNDIDPVVLFIIVVLFGLIIMTFYTKIKNQKNNKKKKVKKNS